MADAFDENLSIEQYKNMCRRLQGMLNKERDESHDRIAALKDQLKILRYAFDGVCGKSFNLQITIGFENLVNKGPQELQDFKYWLMKHHAEMAANEVENSLGKRWEILQAYDEAVRYIDHVVSYHDMPNFNPAPFEKKIFR